VPEKSEFPGTGPKGNGIPETMTSQGQWLHLLKTDSCWSCHQLGDKATREIPKSLGHFDSSTAAWARRILSGQAGNNMANGVAQLGQSEHCQCLRIGRTGSPLANYRPHPRVQKV
jgi:hypothetical protein